MVPRLARAAAPALFAIAVLFAIALAGCGDDGGSGDDASPFPPDDAADTTSPDDSGDDAGEASAPPGRFPIPIPEGGELVAEFPGEATFAYPESDFDALRAFYDRVAADGELLSSDELFDGGFEWQIADGDELHVIVLTLEPPDAVVVARVLDR